MKIPEVKGSFTDAEALALYNQYLHDPGDLTCPRCQVATMEVLGFIEPTPDPNGFARVVPPLGDYAAAVYCWMCQHSIGLRMSR